MQFINQKPTRSKNSIIWLVLMTLIAAGTLLLTVSCGFIPLLFDIEKEEEVFYLKVTVMGYVSIEPSIFIGGAVHIGFVDLDPETGEDYPSPIPWAGFSGSSQYLGEYTGGKGGSYYFTFQNVPKGSYFLLAVIDMNGNDALDLGPSGEPSEPIGVYPMDAEGPYLLKFNTDQFNILISIFYEGFFEDFNDNLAENWVDDGVGRWTVYSNEYIMGGFMFGDYAFSYYDRSFENFTYRVNVQQTAGDWDAKRGIFFRTQNPLEMNTASFAGYRLGFDGNGNWSLIRYDSGGSYSSLGSGFSADLNTMSGANTIEVRCYDSTISLYFNGIEVGKFIDSIYSEGMVGIFAWDDDGSTVEFRYDEATVMW